MHLALPGLSLPAVLLTSTLLAGPAPAAPLEPGDSGRTTAVVSGALLKAGTTTTVGYPREVDGVTPERAEELLAEAEAGIFFPELGKLRILAQKPDDTQAASGGVELRAFLGELERLYPRFGDNALGPYLLKTVVAAEGGHSPAEEAASAGPAPLAVSTVLSEGFEGLAVGSIPAGWTRVDSTSGLHRWGATSCASHAGSRSASALAGGTAYTQLCSEAYPNSFNTHLFRGDTQNVVGAQAAFVQVWFLLNSEAGRDWVNFTFYDGSAHHGYGFSGTWNNWTRFYQNMRAWPTFGDLTVTSKAFCAYFETDGSVTAAYGPRIDDILITKETGPIACSAGSTTLCIDNNAGDRRFRVTVSWFTAQGSGQGGDGRAVATSPLGITRGGIFWFFELGNPEMLVKVLNGCAVNSHFWFFSSAGTNVGLQTTVLDTFTGKMRVYSNPDINPVVPVQDTAAFDCP